MKQMKNIKSTRIFKYLSWWEWEIDYIKPVNNFIGDKSGPWKTRKMAEEDLRKRLAKA